MFKIKLIIITVLTLMIRDNLGRRYDTQIKQNTDFLQHEAIGYNNEGKRDYVSPQKEYNPGNPNDFDSQFPALGSSGKAKTSGSGSTATVPQNKWSMTPPGKRDYVNPNFPQLKPEQGVSSPKPTQPQNFPAKQDPFPPLGSRGTTPKLPSVQNPNAQTSKNRDYVNPNYPLKPTQATTVPHQTGKVKDLVNFFGGNTKDNTSPTQKIPSYSSILNGETKPNPSINTSGIKPSTGMTASTPQPDKRPNTAIRTTPTVLPSSIANQNKRKNTNTNSFTDEELQIVSEELLRKDTNNAAKYITINYQEKTSSSSKEDKASQPLLNVGADVWNIPTVQKFVPLLDNYERDTLVNEYVTPQERNEENAFMDAIMSTSVIRHLMTTLKEKGYVSPDPAKQREFLKQLWFNLYSRGKGKISSSGFEHIFVSELKNGEVSGLHNWVYFTKEETANKINYLGYLKYVELSDKGVVMKLHFNQQGVDKPVNTMFVGTSPELEIAIYTLCFITRADNECKLKLANKEVNIVTHTFRYRSKNLIGSAYPQI